MTQSDSAPDVPPPKWPFALIGPFGNCVLLVGEAMRSVGLTIRSLITFENSRTLLSTVHALLDAKSAERARASIRRLLEKDLGHEEWAREERKNGFAATHATGLIAIWSALEAALEDTFVMLLMNDRRAPTSLRAAGVKVPAALDESCSEPDARRLYSRSERHFRENHGAVEAAIELLRSLGVEASLKWDARSVLNRANAVRNVLLHAGGRIDDRAVSACPELATFLGAKYSVREAEFRAIYDAASDWTGAVIRGVIEYGHRNAPADDNA